MSSKQRNGLNFSESGKLGAIASKAIVRALKEKRIQDYLANPNKCKFCNNNIDYGRKNNIFCSHSCAASFNNKGVRKHGQLPPNCLICSAKTSYSARKYCSRECFFAGRKKESHKSITNGSVHHPYRLRNFLIETRGYGCEICKNSTWMNKPIPIELDHIDGNSSNNFVENLRLLCCNCHAQTETYKGKNVGQGRAKRRQRYREGKSY